MAGTFKFELVTPERTVVSEEANQVMVPGSEGAFTVLPGHAPVISTLRPGVIEASLMSGKNVRAFVKSGFAEVEPDRLVILAERALNVETMGAGDVASELKIAEEELGAARDDLDRLMAAHAIDQLKALQR